MDTTPNETWCCSRAARCINRQLFQFPVIKTELLPQCVYHRHWFSLSIVGIFEGKIHKSHTLGNDFCFIKPWIKSNIRHNLLLCFLKSIFWYVFCRRCSSSAALRKPMLHVVSSYKNLQVKPTFISLDYFTTSLWLMFLNRCFKEPPLYHSQLVDMCLYFISFFRPLHAHTMFSCKK